METEEAKAGGQSNADALGMPQTYEQAINTIHILLRRMGRMDGRIEELEEELDQAIPDDVLREIRSDLRMGDIEQIELLIHYELGDY